MGRRATKSKQLRRNSEAAAEAGLPTPHRPLTWIGVALTVLAVVIVAAVVQSLSWQIQTRLRFTKGQCRVVAAEIVPVAHSFELRIAHQVEVDGRAYGRHENTEQHTPSYNSRSDAEESLARYAVGSVHPCWYNAQDPARYSVLVDRDMDTGRQLGILVVGLTIGASGIWIVRRATRPALTSEDLQR